ncbi:HK97 family phage prohead protease [Chelativorans sp. ZYF759]|uniref:HK97 family phage prohead protease n=1 Tax=Chelativorans sp. ZYF759 TaxID=2692213 RepID=UPI00145CDC25|nr:HK97 family phage prohead protease [Chelativorans sp. ZYF759]NMG39894.1 HK97 family phage prohead protease [Chelativorans sp. ZYF759]
MTREIRGGIPAEIRDEDDGIRVSGYAAVFNEEADIAGLFREIITPGAFREAIGRDDVPFLIQHSGLPLARSKSGTLTLIEDSKGLRMETVLDPDDPDVQRIVPKMKRGDLSKMSFAFKAKRQKWDDTQDPPLRKVEEVELLDVSIVTMPAYDGTEIGLRSLKQHREQVRRTENFHAAQKRVRMKMDLALRERENG